MREPAAIPRDRAVAKRVIDSLLWKGCEDDRMGCCDTPMGADCQVMGHPDFQRDPKILYRCWCRCHLDFKEALAAQKKVMK